MKSSVFLFLFISFGTEWVHSFTTSSDPITCTVPNTGHRGKQRRAAGHGHPPVGLLFFSSNNQQQQQQPQFDMSKPVFDLYSLRTVRGDALTKYNSLNQSEPLRINLAALAVLFFVSSPWLAQDLTGDALTLTQTALTVVGAVGSSALFLRECQRRSRQLTRLEKELAALSLRIRLPSNLLSDAPFQMPRTIRQLERESGIRVIAIYGSASRLKSCLEQLSVFGKRLVQANSFVVAISSNNDGSSERQDWGNSRRTWLAAADSKDGQWQRYFEDLSNNNSPQQTEAFKWFGLSASGRSFASGQGREPSWLQLLGQHLRPVDILLDKDIPVVKYDDKEDDDRHGLLLGQHARFYAALTSGNEQEMEAIFGKQQQHIDEQVTEIMGSGGRLESWNRCLSDGSRPEGMTVADVDVTILSDTLAYTTAIEFPKQLDGAASLLSVQQWTRDLPANADNNDNDSTCWKLARHQTIPWTEASSAGGTLICDSRGCVSLVRSR